MTLMKVGDTTVEDLDYGPLCSCAAAAVKPTCPLRVPSMGVFCLQ
eukprot:COSAG03_NODE_2479_length_2715_cov_2.887232_5_plen_45_part_00